MNDVYLGDGVYASFDGFHIILDLRAQDNTTRIAMDPEVIVALERYLKMVEKTIELHYSNQQDN